jgi:carboxypeptidase A4
VVNDTWFRAYHDYDDHILFLQNLQQQFPTVSEIVSSGNSLGGNPITGIHFWGNSEGEERLTKPAVVLHGTVHAREWITTMACIFLVQIVFGVPFSEALTGAFAS